MNLVSHEYVAMQEAPCPGSRDGPGMLVLSEFRGGTVPVWCYSHQPVEHSGAFMAMHQALTSEKLYVSFSKKVVPVCELAHLPYGRKATRWLMASASRFAHAKNRLDRLSLRSPLKDFMGTKATANVRSLLENAVAMIPMY